MTGEPPAIHRPAHVPFHRLRPGAMAGPAGWMLLRDRYAHAFAAWMQIERVEGGPAPPRAAFVAREVTRLLRHARERSAFWRARLPGGAGRLADLPVLGRDDLRDQVASEGPLPLPPGHGATKAGATSGSTGRPVVFHLSDLARGYNAIRYALDHLQQDRDLSLPLTTVRGGVPEGEWDRWPAILGEMFATGPARLRAAHALTIEAMLDWLREGDRPVGYLAVQPHILAGLLDLIERGAAPPRGVAGIVPWAEAVDGALRGRVAAAFGAGVRIADRYSCEEAGPIAFQCPVEDGALHVATTSVALEVVDERGTPVPDGRPGRVLVTGLNNLATPLIRYDLGDVAEILPGGCLCGHPGPALRTGLLGRTRSLLRLPGGERRFVRLVGSDWRANGLFPREFRLTQHAPDAMTLEVVPEHGVPWDDAMSGRAADLVRAKTHPGMAVTVVVRARINWPGEKRDEVICLV